MAHNWALANLFESVADTVPERRAASADGRRLSYAEVEARANRLADHLKARGYAAGDHVGIYAYNRIEWPEMMMALFKIRAVPVTINYRYTVKELDYMFDNADLKGLLYERRFRDKVDAVCENMPQRHMLELADDSPAGGEPPPGAEDYETALAEASPERRAEPRSSDDIYILYTGGTTGMPKGVLWRHEDIFFAALQGGNPGGMPIKSPEELPEVVRANTEPTSTLVCGPMMHGGGAWSMMIALLSGNNIVIYDNRSFDAARVLDLAEAEKVFGLMLIGDAMARPIAEAIESGERDLSSLGVVSSGGAIISPHIKQKLRESLPNAFLLDSYGASETGSIGLALGQDQSGGPAFTVETCIAVLDDDKKPMAPGDPRTGHLARSGHIPLGYYKDEEKTAATFHTDEQGRRWVLPGDFAKILDDGQVMLLGRGSVSINSGGEKIFPEEVESALRAHPDIYDAIVVGVPHEHFGEQVAAVVQFRDPKTEISLEDLRRHCEEHIAGYKHPRLLIPVAEAPRTSVQKPDYRAAKQLALDYIKKAEAE